MFAMAGMTLAAAGSLPSHASIVITGTRVVYPADSREVTIKINNDGKHPSLVQTWLDKGDVKSRPDQIEVPFVLTPPVSRVDAGKGQTLRLTYTGEPQATDKETLYWLNVLEVPPKAKMAEDANYLQFAFRTRIKVFFRPKGLPYPVSEAPGKLQWSLRPDSGGYALEVSNPTPYHVSFARVGLKVGDQSSIDSDSIGMVEPGKSVRFPFASGLKSPPAGAVKVSFEVINDYGGKETFDIPIGS